MGIRKGTVSIQDIGVHSDIVHEDRVLGFACDPRNCPVDILCIPVQLIHIGDLPLIVRIGWRDRADTAISIVIVVFGIAALLIVHRLAVKNRKRIRTDGLSPDATGIAFRSLIQPVRHLAAGKGRVSRKSRSANRRGSAVRKGVAVGDGTAAAHRRAVAAGGKAVGNGAAVAAGGL